MHRAFVITLGRELDSVTESLSAIYDYRSAHGLLPDDLVAEFLSAPIEAVGNLSNPVELMKQKNEADAQEEASERTAPSILAPRFCAGKGGRISAI